MAEVLFILLLIIGVLGAVIVGLQRRGLMRNGYFTIGASIIIAVIVMITYQTLPLLAMPFTANPSDREILLSLNALGQLVVLVAGSFLLIRATDQDVAATLRLEGVSETPFRLYLLGPPIMFLTSALSTGVSRIWVKALEHLPFYSEIEKLSNLNEEMVAKLTVINTPLDFVFVLLAIAIVPALAEEVFFRGFLQTNIERSGNGRSRPYTAIIVTSLIFALVHVNPFQFPGLLGLGLAMGYMTYRTNNLLVGSFAHAFNNGSIVVLIAISGQVTDETEEMAKFGTGMLLFSMAICACLLAIVIYLFHEWSEPIKARLFAEEEVQAATDFYTSKELERYNDELLEELEARDRASQEKTSRDTPEQKDVNDHS